MLVAISLTRRPQYSPPTLAGKRIVLGVISSVRKYHAGRVTRMHTCMNTDRQLQAYVHTYRQTDR